VSAPNLVQRKRYEHGPNEDWRRHLEVHIERSGKQPERGENQKWWYRHPDQVPTDGSLTGQVLATHLRIESGRRRPYTYAMYCSGVGLVADMAALSGWDGGQASSVAGGQGGGVDAGQHSAQLVEFGQVDAEPCHDGRGISSARLRRRRPVVGQHDVVDRSSTVLRLRLMKPSASKRLSIGDSVAESSCKDAAICLTDNGESPSLAAF